MRGNETRGALPPHVRAYRLLCLGVSLTEQGYDELPAGMGDWLIAIDGAVKEAENEAAEG